MTDTDVTVRQFRYLVSWVRDGRGGGHKHINMPEWKNAEQTQQVMEWIQAAFELEGLPVITSVFSMGEVTP